MPSRIVNSKKPYYKINSCEKTTKIIEVLADKGDLSVAEVASYLRMNRSTCHRFLATLRELEYVSQNPDSSYRLSFRVFELGMKVADRLQVRQIGQPYLNELAHLFKETVNLGYWDGKEIIHIDKINSPEILRMDPGIGSRIPAYCTGLGKSILAFRSVEERKAFLNSVSLKAMTPQTIITAKGLEKELDRVRKHGFAVDNEEFCIGLRCIASPVFDYNDYPSYSVSVAGPASRVTNERINQIQENVRRVCKNFSKNLGAKPHMIEKIFP